jgi:hypothetical protein
MRDQRSLGPCVFVRSRADLRYPALPYFFVAAGRASKDFAEINTQIKLMCVKFVGLGSRYGS